MYETYLDSGVLAAFHHGGAFKNLAEKTAEEDLVAEEKANEKKAERDEENGTGEKKTGSASKKKVW